MKHDQLFDGNTRILHNETPLDIVKEIAAIPGQDEPFYIFDAGDVIHKIKNWKMKLPRVKPFYAVKCNNDPSLLKIMASVGMGFDCAAKSEMQAIIEQGVDPSRIIYANTFKPISHLICANSLGIEMMTFDSDSELYKIKEIMPNAKLVLRIRCDAAKAQCPLGIKFGVLPADVRYLLQLAQDLELNIIGISFHVGSGCEEPQVFLRAIKLSKEVFDQATEMGFKPYLLDIGGGYPGGSNSTLDECAHYINIALEDHFPEELGIEIIAEPGRYLVTSAFTVATKIDDKETVLNNSGEVESTMYYVNDGIYGSFNCVLHDHQVVSPKTLQDCSTTTKVLSSIWGPTCCSLDMIVEEVYLPPLEIGDWLVWKDMGAYTLVGISDYLSLKVPLVHMVMPLHTRVFLEGALGSGHNGNRDSMFDWCRVTKSDI